MNDENLKVEFLLRLYDEYMARYRHYELQRSGIAAAFVAMISLIIGVVTADGVVESSDLPLALIAVAMSICGGLFAAKQYERSSKYICRANGIRNLITIDLADDKFSGLLSKWMTNVDEVHRNRHKWMLPVKVHYLWAGLYGLLALVGLWVTLRALSDGAY